MTIHVTRTHIDNGVDNDCSRCPIALAVHSLLFPDSPILIVNIQRTYITIAGTGTSAELPKSATDFIDDFDSGRPVQPFSFEVNI